MRSLLDWLRTTAIALLVLSFAVDGFATERRAVKSRIAPAYPEIARHMKITGVVKVEAKIDPEGNVIEAQALTGNRALMVAAQDAVRRWKFASAPEASTETVELTFDLPH